MIIVKDQSTGEIIELFDTSLEFKDYLNRTLKGIEQELANDGEGLKNGLLFNTTTIEETPFHDKLSLLNEMCEITIEVK